MKNTKKLFSFALAILLLITAIPLGTVTISADTPSGTAIGTAAGLLALMGDDTKWAQDYYLAADIDLEGVAGQKPIGNATNKFTGSFDGRGYTVSGINITAAGYAGLFGYIDGTAAPRAVSNLTIADSTITSTGASCGGIAAYASGGVSFINCRVASDVTVTLNGAFNAVGGVCGYLLPSAGTVAYMTDCVNEGVVSGYSYVGGVLGFAKNTETSTVVISGCVNTGNITASANRAGGIAGQTDAYSKQTSYYIQITGCMNSGSISAPTYTGGIVGYMGTTAPPASISVLKINGCWNSGSVTGGMTADANYAGGIVSVFHRFGTAKNNLNTGNVTCYTNAAGIISGMTNTGGISYVTENVNQGSITANAAGTKNAVLALDSNNTTKNSDDYKKKNYYLTGTADDVCVPVAAGSVGDVSFYSTLDFTRTWYMTAQGPRLRAFGSPETETDSSLSEQNRYLNPVSAGADPAVLLWEGVYYMYSTNAPNAGYIVYTSTDLVNWSSGGYCLQTGDVYGTPTASAGFWAPEVFEYNGAFYMIYTVEEHLGIASATSPTGPFTNSATSFIFPEKSIDGHVFVDDDGQAYLYYVDINNGNRIYGARFDLNAMTADSSTKKLLISAALPWETKLDNVAEGPFMLKHNGTYYLSYSANGYTSQHYAVGYATSSSPLGSFSKYSGNPILIGDMVNTFGVGHHSFTYSPNGTELFMVYHRHPGQTVANPRNICIDRAYFTSDGVLEIAGPTYSYQNYPSSLTAIGTAAQLLALMGDSAAWGKNYYLTSDIDLEGVAGQSPIGNATVKFTGSFDGRGHTVSGLDITAAGYAGLFGYVDGTAAARTIKDLTIANSAITSTGANCGGIAAYAEGDVSFINCRVASDVTVSYTGSADPAFLGGICGALCPSADTNAYMTNCVNEGTVNGYSHVGGVLGCAINTLTSTAVISGCVNNGSVTASVGRAGGIAGQIETKCTSADYYIEIVGCMNSGSISSPSYIGGIVGYMITATSPPGTISVVKINGCWNSGSVTGGMTSAANYAGGIAGVFQRCGTAKNNLNTGTVTCYKNAAGIIAGMSNGAGGISYLAENVNLGSIVCHASGNKSAVLAFDGTGTTKGSSDYQTKNYYLSDTGTDTCVAVAAADINGRASFGALDFEAVWFMTENGPRLRAFAQTKLVGTAIRTSGDQGLRFKAEIPYAALEAQAEREGYTVKEYGVLIKLESNPNALAYFETVDYESNYNADKIGKGVAYCADDSIDYRFSDNGIKVQFTSVLIGIGEDNYKTDFTYRSYIVLNDGTNDIVLYSTEATTSIYYVAGRIVEKEYNGIVENAPEYVQTIISAK